MNELPVTLPSSSERLAALERINRLDRLFRDADLGLALEIFRADPERFTGPGRPGAVRCIGRRSDGALCGRLFVSPDVRAVRRCASCHQAEDEFATEEWRMNQWNAYFLEDAGGDREPTEEDLAEMEAQLQMDAGEILELTEEELAEMEVLPQELAAPSHTDPEQELGE